MLLPAGGSQSAPACLGLPLKGRSTPNAWKSVPLKHAAFWCSHATCRSNVVQVIYVETLCNPSSDVPDLEAVVSFAKANNLMAFIDNTFASPVLCR